MSETTTYTRSDLIEAVYKSAGVTRSDATLLFDTFLENIIDFLKDNGEFKVAKFGSFALREKAARTGRNPKTGKEVEIAAHNAVVFKPSATLKNLIENGSSAAKKAA